MDERKINELKNLFTDIIRRHVPAESYRWLEEKAALISQEKLSTQLRTTFAVVPRKTGKKVIELTGDEITQVESLGEGFSIKNWPTDRLCRLWLLLAVDASEKENYCKKIDGLFRDAEMHELEALYSSLYLFSYPEAWQLRTAEGIRSNIGSVLEAIMYQNPYPFEWLGEQAWNQMVLKAFFTDKEVDRIIGLDKRANKLLAGILVDYAHERWAAHRAVNPQLWRLVSKFIDEENFFNIKKLFENGNHAEKQAAALACYGSSYEPAKQLLAGEPALNTSIEENKLNWKTINTPI